MWIINLCKTKQSNPCFEVILTMLHKCSIGTQQ
uniref:Uncharacterized protein n=1 Tax=Anguilla anguilla TaxID=7936 RepID=A0A0E9SY36_ANGAN